MIRGKASERRRLFHKILSCVKKVSIIGVKISTPIVSPTHQLNQFIGISDREIIPLKAIAVMPIVAGIKQLTGPPNSKNNIISLSLISSFG